MLCSTSTQTYSRTEHTADADIQECRGPRGYLHGSSINSGRNMLLHSGDYFPLFFSTTVSFNEILGWHGGKGKEGEIAEKLSSRRQILPVADNCFHHLFLVLQNPSTAALGKYTKKKGGKSVVSGVFPSGASAKKTLSTEQFIDFSLGRRRP